ncbi:MAG: hypothetical protein ACI936_001328 [Paraglaciecola sp.]|jgi:hypothetical protein
MKKFKFFALFFLVSCTLTPVSAFSGPTSKPPPAATVEQITRSPKA